MKYVSEERNDKLCAASRKWTVYFTKTEDRDKTTNEKKKTILGRRQSVKERMSGRRMNR